MRRGVTSECGKSSTRCGTTDSREMESRFLTGVYTHKLPAEKGNYDAFGEKISLFGGALVGTKRGNAESTKALVNRK